MRFRTLLLMCFALPAFAQVQNVQIPRMGGSYYASSFSHWTASTSTPVSAPGLATVQMSPPKVTLVANDKIVPVAVGVPIQIQAGAASEVVTPLSVNCDPQSCAMSATFAYAHPGGFSFASASSGIDEATATAAAQGSGTVIVGSNWPGATVQITAAAGRAAVAVLDTRAGASVRYVWNGSRYAISGAPVASGDVQTASPVITPTSSEGTLLADQYGASGSAKSATGVCSASSATVSLSQAIDFKNNQGVALYGCGAAAFEGASITAPTPTVINWCGQNGQMACASAPGSTTYSYAIGVEDGRGGYSAAGGVAATSTGAATLGVGCCNSVAGANYLTWSAPSGIATNAYGYFVYAQKGGGAWRLVGLAGIPGYALPWRPSQVYPPGSYVVPLASPNGNYYVAVAGGTSAATEATWCTSSPTCTVTDGTVTWQRQPFTWMDYGQTAVSPAWVPASPPASGAADRLVATIASGGGTSSITLVSAASTSSATTVYHDDTAALQAALNAEAAACLVSQPAGNASVGNCPRVMIPFGTYRVTAPITLSSYAFLGGAATLSGDEPFLPILSEASVEKAAIADLHFAGGRNAVYVASAAADASTLSITGVDVRDVTDYAFSVGTQEGWTCGGQGCVGLTTHITAQAYQDRMLAYNGGDWMDLSPNTWVEPYTSAQPYEGQIFAAAGSSIGLHGFVGVPDATPYSRWVDDWGAAAVVVDNNSRLGGENGGISALYFLGGFGAAQAFNSGTATRGIGSPFDYLGSSIIIRDSMVIHGNVGLITLLNNSFPQRLLSSNTYWGINSIPVATCSGINQSLLTNQPCPLPAGFTASNLDTVLEGELTNALVLGWDLASSTNLGLNCRLVQPALLPLMQDSACSLAPAPPTAGVWAAPGTNGTSVGQVAVWNSAPTSGSTLAWLLGTNGVMGKSERAAPAWQASHTYTLATSPFGEGDDFVAANGQTFYVSAASSGSTCTSGASAPTWNATVNSSTGKGATTMDGTCTWTAEAVGSKQNGTFGYIAPFSAMPAASFLAIGAVGTMGSGITVLASALPLAGVAAGSTTSLAPNSCGDAVTATVIGAATGMTATAAGQNGLPSTGLTLQAAVTATNTVTIEYCNVTTAAIVPAALTIAVRVVQ